MELPWLKSGTRLRRRAANFPTIGRSTKFWKSLLQYYIGGLTMYKDFPILFLSLSRWIVRVRCKLCLTKVFWMFRVKMGRLLITTKDLLRLTTGWVGNANQRSSGRYSVTTFFESQLHKHRQKLGREQWSSGNGKWLMFKRLWVQIPAQQIGWTFLSH